MIYKQVQSLSGLGIALGTLFFAASLTPTLVPRSYLTQGLLGGGCFAIGYGAGIAGRWLWQYLEIPEMPPKARRIANAIIFAFCFAVALAFLWQSAAWQNSIRAVMNMAPVESSHPIKLCLVAIATFALLLILARLFAALVRRIVRLLKRLVPRRIANVAGFGIAVVLVWSFTSNVLVTSVFHLLDSSYSKYDALFEPERPRPADSSKTGSPASLIKWNELGRAGREFIADAPAASEIHGFTSRPALEPIRVYVGLRGGKTAQARAKLALAELIRVGGFNRSTLIVITPTGTGWIDPASMRAVEYLLHGDVASVAVQYSYLSSPLSLLAQPDYGAEAARELFLAIYEYWTALPAQSRPKLYLHGLSLGAMNSERSAQLFETISDPIAGALWSGPPFESRMWRSISNARNPQSPQWLPIFRDSSLVRFTNQNGPAVPQETPWGRLRIVYLQYASDAIVFFDFRDAYRQPAWMKAPRGPDVSPALTWYPIVTMLQLALDMAFATTTPIGHGHVYAAQHYVEAWLAVTGAQNWSAEALHALKRHLASNTPVQSDDRGG